MRDADNNRDYSRMSPKDTYVKLNINRRTLSVYEQYLKKKMQGGSQERMIEGQDPDILVSDDLSPPKDALRDSAMPTQNSAKLSTNDPQALLYVGRVGSPEPKTDYSTKLLAIIGVFCTLLLVAFIVIVFNATNILVALTDRMSTVNHQISQVSDSITVIGKENSLATAKAIEDERAINASNAASLASVKQSLNSIASSSELQAKPAPNMTTRVRSLQLGESNADSETVESAADNSKSNPAISYDAFKQESQAVLYRESGN